MRLRKLAAGVLVGLVGMASAHANVIYNFEPDAGTGGSYPTAGDGVAFVKATGGQLVITDAAYRSGVVHVDYRPSTAYAGAMDSPIRFASVDATPDGAFVDPSDPAFYLANGGGFQLVADLIFREDGLLDGSIFLHAPSTLLDATGDGDQWIVDHLLSDFFLSDSPCVGDSDGCYAGTGRWVLDASSLSAPEPATWALYAIALLGMVAAVGRRRMG